MKPRKSIGDWFVYEEPGVTPDGQLGVCRRQVKKLSHKIIPAEAG